MCSPPLYSFSPSPYKFSGYKPRQTSKIHLPWSKKFLLRLFSVCAQLPLLNHVDSSCERKLQLFIISSWALRYISGCVLMTKELIELFTPTNFLSHQRSNLLFCRTWTWFVCSCALKTACIYQTVYLVLVFLSQCSPLHSQIPIQTDTFIKLRGNLA